MPFLSNRTGWNRQAVRATVLAFIIFLSAAAVSLTMRATLGFYPWHIGSVVGIATGFGARLACSLYYVSGFDLSKIRNDLESYSPVNQLLELTPREAALGMSATLAGFGLATATYRPGLGCSLDSDDSTALGRLLVSPGTPDSHSIWPQGSRIDSIDRGLQAEVQQILADDNQDGLDSRALLLVVNGRIVAEAYADGIDPETPLLGWSMAKSLAAVMQARAERLGVGSTASQSLFTEWQNDERRSISVQDLLQMSSGLEFGEVYAPGSDATRMLFAAFSAAQVAIDKPLLHPPGTHFAYSSGSSNMLMHWLTEQLGQHTDLPEQATLDFLHGQILDPLHMHDTVFETDPSGTLVGSSFVYAPARDWARLGLLMLNDGQVESDTDERRQLISSAWVTAATQPNRSSNDSRYGYHFWLNSGRDNEALRQPLMPADAYYMSGNRGQYVVMVPSSEMIFVRLGWSSGSYPLGKRVQTLLQAVGAR